MLKAQAQYLLVLLIVVVVNSLILLQMMGNKTHKPYGFKLCDWMDYRFLIESFIALEILAVLITLYGVLEFCI